MSVQVGDLAVGDVVVIDTDQVDSLVVPGRRLRGTAFRVQVLRLGTAYPVTVSRHEPGFELALALAPWEIRPATPDETRAFQLDQLAGGGL